MVHDKDKIIQVDIEEQMKNTYIDYSMSVIVSRALPDVRDGLKPVHRRILFGMNELGNYSNKPYKKSARTVGDVLGKYHPHGDNSIYFSLVRMAQHWSLRYPLIDGQGNFGSIDGDAPAAMRYTESRLSHLAEEMLRDIDENTVDFDLNFDDTLKEPVILPSRIPNLLINGASGIAVGMATNMPPHNITECIDGIISYIDTKGEIDVDGLIKYIKAPDFPTGATIYGYQGVKDVFETGRGKILLRGKTNIETHNGKEKIIISEIPYLVNKKELIEHIVDLINEKKLDGIYHINDESDREGMRIVINVKKDFNSNVLLNKLYKLTALESSFNVNNIALVKGRPKILNLKELICCFVEHRIEIVTRRTTYNLSKAEKQLNVVNGLIIASNYIDEVVHIIRFSQNSTEAINRLMDRFHLIEIQARAIVEMRLRQLTALELNRLHEELNNLKKMIISWKEILSDRNILMKVIKDELVEVKNKFGDTRKTDIVYSTEDMNPEDFYTDEEMIITISHLGYIKRTPLADFKSQNRGGVGVKSSEIRDEDFIEYVYAANMHATMLFFTQNGKCHWLKVYQLPGGTKISKGRAIQNLLNIDMNDKVNAFIRVKYLDDKNFVESHYLIFCTKKGIIKKTPLKVYSRPRPNGINAITTNSDDEVIEVKITDGDNEIIIASKKGRALRFNESKVRSMGRLASGVKSMILDPIDDEVIGMIAIQDKEKENVLVVSERGYGKRSRINDYPVTNRRGKGVKTLNVTEKTGFLVSIKNVSENNDVMIINKSGVAIRMKISDLNIKGRATQGVRLINLEKRCDKIASVCKIVLEDI
jgi:DNA gyrase subunit A